MWVVTTQQGTLTSAPATSDAWLLAGGPDDPDAANVDGGQLIERRRNGNAADTPMDILARMPALVVLERIPVPALAMARDGIILFANPAFAEMVGYAQETLAGLAFPDVFRTVPAAVFALSGVQALANMVVELAHFEGWIVRARMSRSALMRRDDQVVLVTFDDLTEHLWLDEH